MVAKENGSLCFVELLRPDNRLITEGAQLRRKTDGRIVDELDIITDGESFSWSQIEITNPSYDSNCQRLDALDGRVS